MSYMTISSQENHHFSLCSYFHAHPTTLLLKILGWTNAWAAPTSNFGGLSPQSPLGLRPCNQSVISQSVVSQSVTQSQSIISFIQSVNQPKHVSHRTRHCRQ